MDWSNHRRHTRSTRTMLPKRTKSAQSIRHQSPFFFSTSTLAHRSSVRPHQPTPSPDLQRSNSTEWKTSFEWEPELQRRQRVAKERRPKASKFIDHIKVLVRAGSGGDGGVAFHREKFVARGGPSGGNGGQGGSVYLRPSDEVQSLNRIPKILRADPGGNGGGQWMSGQAGKDLIIDVPIGTIVREIRTSQTLAQRKSSLAFDSGSRPPKASDLLGEDIQTAKARRSKLFVHYPESEDSNQNNEVLKNLEINLLQEQWEVEKARAESVPLLIDCAEFHENRCHEQVPDSSTQLHRRLKPDQEYFLVAKGGEGGLGNSNFSGNQTTLPRFATRGRKGEVVELELELKTLADIGLVGFPNSGKSTLIHTLTNSRAEIAPYPFTTLNPQIGTLIIFHDGTWDLDEQHKSIKDSPSPKQYLDAVSASDLIRDRSNRQRLSKDQPNHKCESMRLTIADCPGLLPRASENVGLGHAFLRHIERSKMLIVVIDLMAGLPISTSSSSKLSENRVTLEDGDPERCSRDVETLFKELESYQTGLSGRVGILIANKADLSSSDDHLKQIAQVRLQVLRDYIDSFLKFQVETGLRNSSLISQNIVVLPISAKFRLNIKKLVALIKQFLKSSNQE